MLKRRNKKSVIDKIRDFIYPKIGLLRATKYATHRLSRLPATPYQIACGFACGAGISFTPFIGLHFVMSMIMAFILRGSVLASAIGTIVGNPLTFPFIWALVYSTGTMILGINNNINIAELFSYTLAEFGKINSWHFMLFTDYNNAVSQWDVYADRWAGIWENIYPLFIGSLIWLVIVWTVFFVILYPLIIYYKKIRINRIQFNSLNDKSLTKGKK